MRILNIVLAFVLSASILQAGEMGKKELKERFKGRFLAIEKQKEAGRIGENREGYLEAVKDEYLQDKAVKELIKAENADRKALYELMAEETGADAKTVARHNAMRIYKNAEPGEYLKKADGSWYRKE